MARLRAFAQFSGISPRTAEVLCRYPRETQLDIAATLAENGSAWAEALERIVAEHDYNYRRLPPWRQLRFMVAEAALAAKSGGRQPREEARAASWEIEEWAPHCAAVVAYLVRLIRREIADMPPERRAQWTRERIWHHALTVGRRIAVEQDQAYQEHAEHLQRHWVSLPIPARIWAAWERQHTEPRETYECLSACSLPGPQHLHWGFVDGD